MTNILFYGATRGTSRRQAALMAYKKEDAGAIVTRGQRALGEI
jgi:hypothetical protein